MMRFVAGWVGVQQATGRSCLLLAAMMLCAPALAAQQGDSATHPPARVIVTAGGLWNGLDAPSGPVTLIIEDGRIASIRPGRAAASEKGHHFDFNDWIITPAGFGISAAASALNKTGLAPASRLIEREVATAPQFLASARAGATSFLLSEFPQATLGGTSSVYRPLDYWSENREVVRDVGVTAGLRARTIPPTRTAMEASWEVRKAMLLARNQKPAGALGMLMSGSMEFQVATPTLAEFARAVSIAREFGVPLLATGVTRIPVAPLPYKSVRVLLGAPRLDELPEFWNTYASLQRQRIPAGIATGDVPLPTLLALSRPYAAAHGLTEAGMLAAFTSAPAALLGARELGQIAPHHSADFLVISGKLFDSRARVERVFIEGREVFNRERPRQ
jgi:hypothetical protein